MEKGSMCFQTGKATEGECFPRVQEMATGKESKLQDQVPTLRPLSSDITATVNIIRP